jgi:hypothetical protein
MTIAPSGCLRQNKAAVVALLCVVASCSALRVAPSVKAMPARSRLTTSSSLQMAFGDDVPELRPPKSMYSNGEGKP